MDVLHKQVKPFMLRRMKSDVLDDLPPKILQDYYCDLSSIQCMLYEDFANKTKEQVKYVDNDSHNQNGNPATGHVFRVKIKGNLLFFYIDKFLYFKLGITIFT
jgi:TATA-binding protein-associated factor